MSKKLIVEIDGKEHWVDHDTYKAHEDFYKKHTLIGSGETKTMTREEIKKQYPLTEKEAFAIDQVTTRFPKPGELYNCGKMEEEEYPTHPRWEEKTPRSRSPETPTGA